MKIRILAKKTLLLAAASVALSSQVSGVTISYAVNGFGEWTPANLFNSDPALPGGVTRSVNIWNGDASAGLFGGATFSEGSGTAVPAVLPLNILYVDRKELEENQWANWAGLDNSLGTYTYVTAKYGNATQQAFYVGNVLDVIKLPTSLGRGAGLSHVSWLTSDKPGSRVPDGGTTLLSLGVALLGLGSMRKLLAAKA